ncbi:hypothetical protein PCCS19_34170 [Paenibacillus sp. CCS19]|nr:hypothetical protein PCCS19_34170 [Paenibacillus cellulosilyticus]
MVRLDDSDVIHHAAAVQPDLERYMNMNKRPFPEADSSAIGNGLGYLIKGMVVDVPVMLLHFVQWIHLN